MISLFKIATIASSAVKASLWVLIMKFEALSNLALSKFIFFLHLSHNIKVTLENNDISAEKLAGGKGVASQDI